MAAIQGRLISMTVDGQRIDLDGWRPRINVCGTCGCAHRSPYDDCNSCREGKQAARRQITMERLRRAGVVMARAAHSAGVSFAALGDAMRSLGGPSITVSAGDSGFMVVDLGRVDVDLPVAVFNNGRWAENGVPVDFSCFSGALRFDDPCRPAEPRPKRDRRNRGPEQHGKWWRRS